MGMTFLCTLPLRSHCRSQLLFLSCLAVLAVASLVVSVLSLHHVSMLQVVWRGNGPLGPSVCNPVHLSLMPGFVSTVTTSGLVVTVS